MKLKDFLYVVIIGLGLLVFWLLYDKQQRAEEADKIIKRLRKDNHEIKTAYLSLFEKYVQKQNNVDIGIIAEIQKLKNNIDILDFEVHIELEEVINELNAGKAKDAVRRLAKIVEHKLKEKVKKEANFKGKPMLHNLLQYAKEHNWISGNLFESCQYLRDIRNKESHELDASQESYDLSIAILSGIKVLFEINK